MFNTDTAATLGGPVWLQALRQDAVARLGELAWPTPDEEIWRYSRIGELDMANYTPVGPQKRATELVPTGQNLTSLVEAVGACAAVVVTQNGHIRKLDVVESHLASGLRVGGTALWNPADAQYLSEHGSGDAFAALNLAFCPDPVVVGIPSGVVIPQPILVVHRIDEPGAAVLPRLLVRAGEVSQVSIVEVFMSADVPALAVPVTQFEVGPGAVVNYSAIQLWGPQVWQVGHQVSNIARDATFNSTTISLGGDYARVRTDSHLTGIGGTSQLSAMYFGTHGQVHDFRTLQDHEAPKTTSRLLFKGVVGDHARSVYSGLIRVHKGAAGTNAFQTNRNLVLADGDHAATVPNLEIEESDVRCSHASAVGPVDDDQRYYLESKGIPTEVAERLIVLGFLEEILAGMAVEPLHSWLRPQIIERLDALGNPMADNPMAGNPMSNKPTTGVV